jgi:hypothetical protein
LHRSDPVERTRVVLRANRLRVLAYLERQIRERHDDRDAAEELAQVREGLQVQRDPPAVWPVECTSKLSPGDLDDAEQIAVGVLEDDVVGVRTVAPRIPLRAKGEEPIDLEGLLRRVEIEMDPAAPA